MKNYRCPFVIGPQGQCGCVLKGCSWTEHVTYIDVWSEWPISPPGEKKTLGEVFSFSPTYYYLVSIRFIADETKTSCTMSDCYNDIVMAVVCGSLMKIACTKIGIIFIPWPMPISNQRTIMMGTAIFFITTFLMKSLQCLCKFFEKNPHQICKKKGYSVVEVFIKITLKKTFHSSVSLSLINQELINLAIALYKEEIVVIV